MIARATPSKALSWEQPPQQDRQQAPVPRLLLRPQEAADALGVSLRTLMSLADSGDIPSTRIGTRNLRFSVQALEAWIASKTSRAAEETADVSNS
jgi:excisionase family DNA binding protein